MKAHVIIVAAGSGVRFKSTVPKALVRLQGKPLIAHSLRVFEGIKAVGSVVIVGHPKYLKQFQALSRVYQKVKAVVPGGATRADSVKCGLEALSAEEGYVLVHDAARPLIDAALINRLLTALKTHKAVIAAVPAKATIKEVDPKSLNVVKTHRRDVLWEVQTPQGFHKDILIKAHSKPLKVEATDDAMMAEAIGIKVQVVMGDYRNIKVTTPEDLVIAKALL